MSNNQQSLKQMMDNRIEKLNLIKDASINPYPYKFKRSHEISCLIADEKKFIDSTVSIAGRIISLRKMGKVSFVHIQDMSSKIQLFIKKDNVVDDGYNLIVRKIDIGDIVGCKGKLFYTKTNEFSINVTEFTMLSKSIRPLPNLKEKDGKVFFSFDDKEQRYRNRHLDLIANSNVKDIFILRSKIINEIRNFLNTNNFIEVETPVLQNIYGGANARPFITHHNTLDQRFYLRIADELYLKRLIVGGFDKVYEIAKNFRNEGMDKSHNPEFTMLEFYQAYADVNIVMSFTESMIKNIAKIINKKMKIQFKEDVINYTKKFEVYDFFEILNDRCCHNMLKMKNSEIINILKKENVTVDDNINKGKLLDKAFSHFVEPGLIQPTFIINYPIEISPLAKKSSGNDMLVDRFELFIGGMEVANAFSELNDPIDQRARLEEQSKLKGLGDEEAQTLDENFIQSIEYGMPPTGGVGLGIDRIVMLLTSQKSIKDVILFPAMRKDE